MTLKGGRMSHSGFRGLEEGCKNAREDSHDRELSENIGDAMEVTFSANGSATTMD